MWRSGYLMVDHFIAPLNMLSMPSQRHCARKLEKGIKVSTVYSGLVDSHFHADPAGDPSHQGWLSPEDMANSIYYVMNQPAHVVIDELMIHPLNQEY